MRRDPWRLLCWSPVCVSERDAERSRRAQRGRAAVRKLPQLQLLPPAACAPTDPSGGRCTGVPKMATKVLEKAYGSRQTCITSAQLAPCLKKAQCHPNLPDPPSAGNSWYARCAGASLLVSTAAPKPRPPPAPRRKRSPRVTKPPPPPPNKSPNKSPPPPVKKPPPPRPPSPRPPQPPPPPRPPRSPPPPRPRPPPPVCAALQQQCDVRSCAWACTALHGTQRGGVMHMQECHMWRASDPQHCSMTAVMQPADAPLPILQ